MKLQIKEAAASGYNIKRFEFPVEDEDDTFILDISNNKLQMLNVNDEEYESISLVAVWQPE